MTIKSNVLRAATRAALRARSVAVAGVAGSSLLGVFGGGFAVTALAPSVATAAAYTTVDFTGRVTDDKGKPIPNATIAITSEQGTTRRATADDSGQFRLPAMPSGNYKANVSAPGFTDLKDRQISISPGTAAFAFTLSPQGTVIDEVIVSAARPINDFTKTDSGLSINVQDLAERAPIARSVSATVMLAPTVSLADPSIVSNGVRRNQNTVTMSGTSAAESVYYINGLNVTDQRAFLGYSDLPYEMIQTIDVKSGGYSAEFGRGTGGIVNIVTRSGSNEFHWGTSAYWAPDSLRASRSTTYRPGGNNSVGIIDRQKTVEQDQSEQTIWASGPIWRDHIFFFGLYNARQTENWGAAAFTNPINNNGSLLNTKYNDPRWAAKLDFVFNENHRLEATVFSDKEDTDYRPWNYGMAEDRIIGVPGLSNPNGSLLPYQQESGGTNYILQYTGVINQNFTVSALVGRTESSYKDSGPYIDTPGVQDFGTTGSFVTLGRHAGPFNFTGEDERDTYRIDADIYFSAAGEHHIRVGFDYEDLLSTAYSAYTGGALYYAYDAGDCPPGTGADGCVEKLTFANIGEFEATQSAWYIQDEWEITPNFTLMLGVRGDMYDYKNVRGQSYIKITDQIAPRVGFSWDPTDSGRTRVYGSVGDYYLPVATNTSIRASSGEVYTDQYFQATRDADGNLVLDANGFPLMGAQIGPTDYFSPPTAPDPRAVAEADIDPMYEREFSLGLEHRLAWGWLDGWTVGLRYTHRRLKSTIEDTAIGDAIIRYCDRLGLACAANDPGIYPYVLLNPGNGARVFIDLDGDTPADLLGNPNPDYNPQYIDLTAADIALPKAVRKYDAVELTFARPFDGVWSLQGSYVWSKSRGNYEGAVKSDIGQTDTSITQDFDHAANMLGAYGYLPNDRRHTFKLFGSWAPISRFTIGANLLVQSGRPYGCTGYVPPEVDPLAPNSGTPSGWFCPRGAALPDATGTLAAQMAALGLEADRYEKVMTPRGSQGRTDWVYNLDLNLAYKFFESETKGEAVARLDIFNVLNGDAVTRVVEQGEVRTGATGVKGVAAPFYGLPRTYQTPRYVRIGFSYSF
jgi:outer membrane receptor protein involved in Fe transport